MSPVKLSSAEAFRQNLRKRIDELGVSDAEVARRAGMAPPTFWKYLNGERRPGVDLLDRIADAVDLPPHELISPIE